jgi:hypothetical protein
VTNYSLRLFITLLLCVGIIYTPIIQSAQLSLPTGDLIAPEVSHTVIPDTLEAGSSVQIKATVTDNVGVKAVTLFYRTKGEEVYKRISMNRIDETDEYAVTLGKEELVEPGIEYYIQAMDLAGNTLLHGYSFSPLVVNVIAPGGAVAETGATIREEPTAEPKKKTNTWLWIGLGALALGAVAAAAGGGGGDSGTAANNGGGDTGTIVISAPPP